MMEDEIVKLRTSRITMAKAALSRRWLSLLAKWNWKWGRN
jgi:hypothetical protein